MKQLQRPHVYFVVQRILSVRGGREAQWQLWELVHIWVGQEAE